MNKLHFLGIALLASFLVFCKKPAEVIPVTYVNVIIHLNDPAYIKLNAVGGWVYVDGGVRGIIVYRRSNEEFAAFDRNCTYLPSSNCATVYVDKSGSTAIDTCCGSKFTIYDGSVQNGPASIGLKPYHTSFDGSILYISN